MIRLWIDGTFCVLAVGFCPCSCPPTAFICAAGLAEVGLALSVADSGSEVAVLVLDQVGVMGEPPLSVTGEVGVKSELDPCESFVRFFLRKPREGIEAEPARFNGMVEEREDSSMVVVGPAAAEGMGGDHAGTRVGGRHRRLSGELMLGSGEAGSGTLSLVVSKWNLVSLTQA